jgi:hypothetical protein
MRKALCFYREDPVLAELYDAMQVRSKEIDEQIEFLKKRALKIAEDFKGEKVEFYRKVENHLDSRGLLPAGYDRKKDSGWNLHFTKEGTLNVTYEKSTRGDPLLSLIEMLTRPKKD